jgi:hypothetical protein
MLLEMEVSGLALDPNGNTPIILLKSLEGERTLPIWIGILEAASIAMALQKVEFARPMTHDLFKNFLDTIKMAIEKVEICDIKESTYFARIHFSGSGKSAMTMDARPSDAIAMALRAKAPIFCEEKVLDESAKTMPAGEPVDDSEEGRKWADYLASLDADDFGKYKM